MITNYESIMNYSIWFGHPQVVDPLDLEYLEDNGIHGGVPDGCFAINFLKDCDKKKGLYILDMNSPDLSIVPRDDIKCILQQPNYIGSRRNILKFDLFLWSLWFDGVW